MDMKPSKELFASFGFEQSGLNGNNNNNNTSWNSDTSEPSPLSKSMIGIWTNDDSRGSSGNHGLGSSQSQHSDRTYSQSSNLSWNSDLSPTAHWVNSTGLQNGLSGRSSPRSTTTTLVDPGSPDAVFPYPHNTGSTDGIFPYAQELGDGLFPLPQLATTERGRLNNLGTRISDNHFPITLESRNPDAVFPLSPESRNRAGILQNSPESRSRDGIFHSSPEPRNREGIFYSSPDSRNRDGIFHSSPEPRNRDGIFYSSPESRNRDGIFHSIPETRVRGDGIFPIPKHQNAEGVFPISSGNSDVLCNISGGGSDGIFPISSTTSDELRIFSKKHSLDLAAKQHRELASQIQPSHVWRGELPPRNYDNATFSCKVFLGGLPFDMTEFAMIQSFRPFGNVKIEWPGKDSYPNSQAKGYAYVIFENEQQVKMMLSHCVRRGAEDSKWYCKLSSRQVKMKVVEVIPWAINDSNFYRRTVKNLEGSMTIFVGALHGMLNAEGLCTVMHQLFGGVVHAAIDTDKWKYPIGSGRVTFDNYRSYFQAVTAAYVNIESPKFHKTIQVDPYVEDAICSECSVQQGPYYCRDLACFRYFCRTCYETYHCTPELMVHLPVMRNPNKHGQKTFGINGQAPWNSSTGGFNNGGRWQGENGNPRPTNRGKGFLHQGNYNNNWSQGRNALRPNQQQKNYSYGQNNMSTNPHWASQNSYNNGYGGSGYNNSNPGSHYNSSLGYGQAYNSSNSGSHYNSTPWV